MKSCMITFVFIVILLTPGHSQVKNGRYVSENSETGEMIDIRLEKGSFIYKRVSIQDSMYGSGNFSIIEKKFMLTFSKITGRKFPKWQITKREDWVNTSNSTLLELYVFDRSNNLPFDGAFVVLQSDSTNVIQFFTNASGKSNFFIWNPDIINWIIIAFPGYERIKIPVEILQNQKVSISCFLDLIQQKPEIHKMEYLIDNISKKGFDLLDTNGVRYLFEKKPD
ncbi:MAG TPA: hypothetical protein PK325_03255 [Cyclobacteriaceae bacterium]|nr:hypothetical protein [Cyclobacteriaceae bacterium]HMV09905.1 hypothetical protein [Cyclobacteriaceae bacterium]HMV88731.1 hypothetical protein [Cyclobacteriaceae bacterium]HMW99643.1 hypothetical protein [Cyclobacteriaceae bacterium]HMX50980.1 hypothetical protein [Cyclobacteriaceae bacterium]